MRTALKTCGCTPFIVGSGAIYHNAKCPQKPNQGLTYAERKAWVMANRAAARIDHPAKGTVQPLRSVRDSDYVEAHLDDLDDREELES